MRGRFALSLFTFVLSFTVPQTALSAVKMTDVSVKRSQKGVAIDMSFDRPVAARQLKPDFERNFVQVVLRATKIDSAQMIPVSESEVQKIFAYPYSPEVTRIRIILKGDNKWAKGRVSLWNNNPKSVRIFVKDPQGEAVSAVKKALSVEKPREAELGEADIIKEVVANTKEIDIHNPESVKAALGSTGPKAPAQPETARAPAKEENQAIGVKQDPSRNFARMAIALFAVVAACLGVLLLVKRYSANLKKLPFGKKERLIQVVSTHYLGNKKSISLVKITGEYMVVGVSNESVQLITKLGPEINVDKYLEDRFWGGTFEKHLGTYSKDSKVGKEIELDDATDAMLEAKFAEPAPAIASQRDPEFDAAPSAPAYNVRASIKEKLTGMKPLA